MILKGHIDSLKDVYRINEIATKQSFDVYVSDKSTIVDAKSFVCLFNLIGHDVNVIVDDNGDVKAFKKMFKKMKI